MLFAEFEAMQKSRGVEASAPTDLFYPDLNVRAPRPPQSEIIPAAREVGSKEGLFVCPEGAACFAALKSLRSTGKIVPGERVVIFNTGSGIKYLDLYGG